MAEKIALFEAKKDVITWQELAKQAVNSCPKIKKEREKEILSARFGIESKAKTLQAIGNEYEITRERVRQIVNNSLLKIRKYCTSQEIKNLLKEIETFVSENGGYVSSKSLAAKFTDGTDREINGLNFITGLSTNLENVKTSNIFHEGWRKKNIRMGDLNSISTAAYKLLKESGKVMNLSGLASALEKDEKLVLAALSANKNLMLDDNKNWGLTRWPHINPRSIRDKSKYIMVRHGKPMHYGTLAQKISEIGTKEVTKQSVHNELIKNKEFVLVGRGIYALSEWGYAPGIVEEVIVTVLTEAGEPLAKEIIVERVLERRLVKPSTIVLNLQRPRFKKVGKAVYTLN